MIENLSVRNFALIKEAHIDFKDGLNVLTGETGSGKAILLGSLNLALGMRANKDVIRDDNDETSVTMSFNVTDNDLLEYFKSLDINIEDGRIVIYRKISHDKNVVKNIVMLSMIETAINNIFVGQSWIQPFENAKLSNTMITEMLKIGMQTDLTEMMEKLVEYMDQDIDNTMEKIMKVLPEVSYAIVGVVLIFFVVVVLVPCIQVYMGGFLFSAYGF